MSHQDKQTKSTPLFVQSDNRLTSRSYTPFYQLPWKPRATINAREQR